MEIKGVIQGQPAKWIEQPKPEGRYMPDKRNADIWDPAGRFPRPHRWVHGSEQRRGITHGSLRHKVAMKRAIQREMKARGTSYTAGYSFLEETIVEELKKIRMTPRERRHEKARDEAEMVKMFGADWKTKFKKA